MMKYQKSMSKEPIKLPDDDLFELKRIEVRGGDWLDKRLKIYKNPFLSRVYAKIYRKI